MNTWRLPTCVALARAATWQRRRRSGSRVLFEPFERRRLLSVAISEVATITGTGIGPYAPGVVFDSAQDVFGVTQFGGDNGDGSVWMIAANGSTVNTLHSFNGTDGSYLEAGLVADKAGDMFGATISGGAFNKGTVFEISAPGRTFSTLGSFDGTNYQDNNGKVIGTRVDNAAQLTMPQNIVVPLQADSTTPPQIVDAKGNRFTTSGYGENVFTVKEEPAGTTSLTTIAIQQDHNSYDRGTSVLVPDRQGNLYAIAQQASYPGIGWIFKITGTDYALPPVVHQTFFVTNTADSGTGSLRDAINSANANPGSDTINFNIPTASRQTIALTSPLPAIIDPVTIDATTNAGYARRHLIAIDGTNAGNSANGIELAAGSDGSIIDGLSIGNFAGAGISVTSSQNQILDDFVGTVDGVSPAPNNIGIGERGIGDVIRNCVIGGNLSDGIQIGAASNLIVAGNAIGLTADGYAPLPNGGNGVYFFGVDHNVLIGGTTISDRNTISGNKAAGVEVGETFSSATIQGNFIGLDSAGTRAIGNQIGIHIFAHRCMIGGTQPGAGNVISGNLDDGLFLYQTHSYSNTIQGNLIGTNASGTAAVANGGDGIRLRYGSNYNQIGGTIAGAGNIIAGNLGDGIGIGYSNDIECYGNTVQGNRIGVGRGGVVIPNQQSGVHLVGETAVNNLIGGLETGAGNVIEGNRAYGVLSETYYPGESSQILRTQIYSNSIFRNGAPGIHVVRDLNTPFPVVTVISANQSTGTQTIVHGTIGGDAGPYEVQIFSNAKAAPNGNGEGQTLEYSTVVNKAAGIDQFTFSIPSSISAGQFITATTTNTAAGGPALVGIWPTSEFSNAVAVPPIVSAPPPIRFVTPATGPATLSGSTAKLFCKATTDAGSGSLIYTWTVTKSPPGAKSPKFSVNGVHVSAHTTITFRKAGTYHLRCTVTDRQGHAVFSNVSVRVA